MSSSHVTQNELNEAFKLAESYIRPPPFKAKKKSTKIVKLAYPGETIETWIDTGNTVVLELLRTVPTDGHYIIIIDALKNSQTKEHKYFIPYADFCKRYTLIDGTSITEDMTSQFETTTMVQAIGIITGFAAIEEDTYTGDYEKPASWGKGIAGGADQEGYWMASIEKPTEWYFMPYTHFERDYEIL